MLGVLTRNHHFMSADYSPQSAVVLWLLKLILCAATIAIVQHLLCAAAPATAIEQQNELCTTGLKSWSSLASLVVLYPLTSHFAHSG